MLDGRVALVTGGNAGIGRAIALGLADAGATVVVVDGPVTSAAEARRAFATAARRSGPVDTVVHALVEPAALAVAPLTETDEQEWDVRCEAVLRSTLWCCQAAFAVLQESGGHLVLVIPTIALTGAAGLVPYAGAVEGMRAMAKSAARQWGAHGITVNCVAAPVELMAPDGVPRPEGPAGIGEPALGRPPDARADVAPVVALLTSAAAHFVTGATVVVDGGIVMAP